MNRRFWGISIVLIGLSYGQNLQVLYDSGSGRNYVTTTLEMFKPDAFGSTFWFVDFNYNQPGNYGASVGYLEIARVINLPYTKLQGTVQYNDGVAPWGSLGPVWLGGVHVPVKLPYFPFSIEFLYRSNPHAESAHFQTTVAWFKPFLGNRVTTSGFLDIWSSDDPAGTGKRWIVLAEPQLWYQVWDNASIGGELEISHNFMPTGDWEFKPALGLKWIF